MYEHSIPSHVWIQCILSCVSTMFLLMHEHSVSFHVWIQCFSSCICTACLFRYEYNVSSHVWIVCFFMYEYSVSSHAWIQYLSCMITVFLLICMSTVYLFMYEYTFHGWVQPFFLFIQVFLPILGLFSSSVLSFAMVLFKSLIFDFQCASVSERDEEKETNAEFPSFLDHEGRHGFSKIRSSNIRIKRRVRLYSVLLEMVRTSSPSEQQVAKTLSIGR